MRNYKTKKDFVYTHTTPVYQCDVQQECGVLDGFTDHTDFEQNAEDIEDPLNECVIDPESHSCDPDPLVSFILGFGITKKWDEDLEHFN